MNWQIGGGSVDRSWIRIGLMIWARTDRLTLPWQIVNGLAWDLQRIGIELLNWSRINVRLEDR